MPPGASSGSVLPRLAGIVLPSLRVALALPLAYFAAAALAIDLTGRTDNVAAVWYANAILLAALLRHPPRAWPALLLLAGAANVADDLLFGSSLALSLGFTGRDLLEALLAASVLRRLGPARGPRSPPGCCAGRGAAGRGSARCPRWSCSSASPCPPRPRPPRSAPACSGSLTGRRSWRPGGSSTSRTRSAW